MRIPVLTSDLPHKFNKVAKYLGRHWPAGKLGLNASREVLAYLLGYNSVHELNAVAQPSLPSSDIRYQKVLSSISCKALYKFGLGPDRLVKILRKAPFKELAFYAVTDVGREEQWIKDFRKSGIYIIDDELSYFGSYASPKLIIEQNDDLSIPGYQYAMKSDGLIFSSSRYESIIYALGDIDEIVNEMDEGVTSQDFIENYITPLAWVPVDEYVSERDRDGRISWKTPFYIQVFQARENENVVGYMLYHTGLKAYYPGIYESDELVVQALAASFKGTAIPQGATSFSPKLELSLSSNSTTLLYGFWHKVDFTNAEIIRFNSEELIRSERFKPYPHLLKNSVMKRFEWEASELIAIDNNVIEADLYRDHVAIRSSLESIQNKSIADVALLSQDEITNTLQKAYGGKVIKFEDVLATEYDEDYEPYQDDREKWLRVGAGVLHHHPELSGFMDTLSAGLKYCSFQALAMNNRWAYTCSERCPEFIGYIVTEAYPLLGGKSTMEDRIFAGLVTLTDRTDFTAKEIQQHIKEITETLSLHHKQEHDIAKMEGYSTYLREKDAQYVSHGSKVRYQRVSYRESMGEILREGRKHNVGFLPAVQSKDEVKYLASGKKKKR